jgi:hypothetical protein
MSVHKLWDLVDADARKELNTWAKITRVDSLADTSEDLENRLKFLRYLTENTIATFDNIDELKMVTPFQILLQTAHSWSRIAESDSTSTTQWVFS